MMLCKFCNREIADDSRFCIFCGSSQQETMPGESGTPNLPAETLPPVVYAVPANSQELSKPKSKKRLGLIMGLVGGFVVIAMIAALLLGQGGIDPGRSSSLSGPLATIAEASKNAVKNGECAFQMTVDVMGEKIQAYYWTEMNQGMTSGSMYMDEEVGGQQIQFVLHDNRMMIRTGDVWEYQDMSYMNYMNMIPAGADMGQANVDLEDIIDYLLFIDPELYVQIQKTVDMDQLNAVVDTLEERFSDEAWLSDYMGYSARSNAGETVYCFDINLGTLLRGCLETAEPAFRDPQAYQTILQEMRMYEDVIFRDTVFTLEFHVEEDTLTAIGVSMVVESEQVDILMEFLDADSIPVYEEMLTALLDEAEKRTR